MTVKDLYTDKSKWTTGARARSAYGCPVGVNSVSAVSWCLSGAIDRCYHDNWQEKMKATKRLTNVFQNIYGSCIPLFNDSVTTTFEEVLKVVEEARI